MAHHVIWTFEVPEAERPAFERIYGPEGDWVRLFRRCAGYLGTELLADSEQAGRYLTVDRWSSREAYELARTTHAAEYVALDAQCTTLTSRETLIGAFTPTAA